MLPLVSRFEEDPGWLRRLSPEDRAAIDHRMWVEGRLKVFPCAAAASRASRCGRRWSAARGPARPARHSRRDVKAVHGDLHVLIDAGVLDKTERNHVVFVDGGPAAVVALAARGLLTLGAPNRPAAYPRLAPALRTRRSSSLLDAERGVR